MKINIQKRIIIRILNLVIKLLRKINFNKEILFKINNLKHYYVENIINIYTPVTKHPSRYKNNNIENKSNYLWVFWWQGEDEAPLLIKSCISSIRKNSKNYNLIVVDKKNWLEYIHLPMDIIKKIHEKRISLTHMSDIVRFHLLNNYGGLWLDATVYVSNEIPNFSLPYWTTKNSPQDVFCVSKARWNGAIMYCDKGYHFAQFMEECFINYWHENDFLIDYFLIDYFTDIAFKKLESFNSIFFKIQDNKMLCFELQKHLNCPLNYIFESQILTKATFHKLQRRSNYMSVFNDKETVYSYILK